MKRRVAKQKKTAPFNTARIKAIKYIFYCCLLVILTKAFQIQNLSKSDIKKQTKAIYTKNIVVQKKRGSIYDRNGHILAMTIDAFDIAIRPPYTDSDISGKVAEIIGLPRQYVLKTMKSNLNYIYLKRKVPADIAKKLQIFIKKRNLNNRAFDFRKTTARIYPNKTLAGALIGYTNMISEKTGIEKKYDHFLEGDKVETSIISAGRGNWYDEKFSLENANKGNDIYLTIDTTIQHIAEEALYKGVKKSDAREGKAVVMNPNSGEILAMAQYPSFNPNIYSKFSPRYRNNRNALDAFEPGSIMKVFLVAGALEEGSCTKKDIFYCNNGSYKIGTVTIHDTKPHKWLKVKDIIKHSSNIGATKIAEVMGRKTLHNILKKFGFSEKTGIDLPIETKGILRPAYKWTDVDISNIAFGQGMAASTIQLAVAGSALANNGYLLKPALVKRIEGPDKSILFKFKKTIKRKVISPATSRTIRDMMKSVVSSDGTAPNAALIGYSAGGKTGTSQKLGKNGKYSNKKFIASFLGITPIENPKLVIIVMIDEPQNSHYGGTVAAPVFKEIASKTLKYMNVFTTDITIALNKGKK